jgi:2-amino-4-hydroxy-6-hydroxymethyldihydropteridine diphosphokinase
MKHVHGPFCDISMRKRNNGIFLGLGTNKRGRENSLFRALERIHSHPDMQLLKISSLYKSAPWGMEDQPWFLNAVCQIETNLSPCDLLRELKQMEKDLGRIIPEVRWGPRKIDIDIILFHDSIIDTPDLRVPHKHLTERLFVLIPLLELVPEGLHPETGISFKDYVEKFQLEDRRRLCSLYTPKVKTRPGSWGNF